MLIIAGFTGVFGIGMLLILQYLALTGFGMLLGGPFAIIIFMIGIAYRSLLNPDLPFLNCLMISLSPTTIESMDEASSARC